MGFDQGAKMIFQMFFWACGLILAIQVAGRLLLMLLGYTSDEIEEELQRPCDTQDTREQQELREWWARQEAEDTWSEIHRLMDLED